MESQQWTGAVFIGGTFRRPAAGGTLAVRDKASGEIFATAGQAGPDDVGTAVTAASQAQPLWAERTYAERASILRAAAGALERQAGEFRELIMRETGCIGGKADYEIAAASSELIEAAGLASRATGEVLPTGHAGRTIAATAGQLLKKVSLELGGNNALLVLDDADPDQAAMIGAWSSFHYQGQTCITAGRHIVGRGIAGTYVQKLAARADAIAVGNTVTQDVGLDPMISQRQLERARQMLDEAVAQGAKVVAGGSTDGPFFRPTVVTEVPRGSRLWTEEIFAPIAPVTVVEDPDEAVALANDTKYGPVDAVLTGDAQAGLQLARRLRAGMVHVNDATPQDEALAPFGGIGQSGLGGRSGGDANIEEFTERRWLNVNPGPAHYPY